MLARFYQQNDGYLTISKQQGSQFAKQIADDFNPLHDEQAKRFCVPGDLLFALVLENYGVSEKMHFTFSAMVDDKSKLHFPPAAQQFAIGEGEKCYLSVTREGQNSRNQTLAHSLIKSYVEFSGTTFPHTIIPIMAAKGVMINPARPMVIYESMSIELNRLNLSAPSLKPAQHEFNYTGKRGKIILRFDLLDQGKVVGHGEKHMLVSGINQYCQQAVDDLTYFYNQRKQAS